MVYSVAIFCEGEHARTVSQIETEERAEAIGAGVVIGASLYGAGNVAAYVLPNDAKNMAMEQRPEEVSKVR